VIGINGTNMGWCPGYFPEAFFAKAKWRELMPFAQLPVELSVTWDPGS
jgi:hypothetical protein